MLDAPELAKEFLTLLFAFPHKWGSGAVHIFDRGENKTLCGKSRALCEGQLRRERVARVNCKVCAHARESRLEWAQRSAGWEAQYQQREKERAEASRRWWDSYNIYLQNPIWLEKRRAVMRRCGGICEGCASAKAVQVHHRCYPQGELPGSDVWIRLEKLFDLVGLCQNCHQDLHPE